ncbi:MAG: AraC family transcriptional regulator [Spirochaetes bacterium]|nr:AraC family transcriptional regulator [Spirochaetota bacterium]
MASFPAHAHDLWEAVFYLSGEGVVSVGDERLAFEPGALLLTPPRLAHQEKAKKTYSNLGLRFYRADLPRKPRLMTHLLGSNIEDLLRLLHREFLLNGQKPGESCDHLLAVFLSQVSRAPLGRRPTTERLKHLLVDHIHDHAFTIRDGARRCGAPYRTLLEAFRADEGRTPMEFLIELRLNEGKSLLETTGVPVAEVARMIGFEDPYYFSRLFRRKVGLTPSAYRRRNNPA